MSERLLEMYEDIKEKDARIAELRAENELLKQDLRALEHELEGEINALRARVAELEALLKDAENSLDPHYDMALVIEIREALAGKEE